MTQHRLNFEGELIVDNFAGGGGASIGIEAGAGRPVDIAINHDATALAMHAVNHPATLHLRENLLDVDPVRATGGRPVGLAWFSPDCTHFSKAAGRKPRRKEIRGLAWVVLRWMSRVRPRVVMLENVEEFQEWGPLDRTGRPCARRKGQTFHQWIGHIRALGYAVEWRQLRACDYGAPTIRKRLFVIARRDSRPIVWPEPTHGTRRRPYRTAAEIIDWSLPCPSIFERKKPLAEATLRRIAHGIQRFVIGSAEPFIVRPGHYSNITGEGAHFRGQPLDRPLSTVCAQGNDKALIVPTLLRNNPGNPPRDVREALGTVTTADNRHALVAAFLAQHNGGAVGRKAAAPLATVTASAAQVQAVTSHLVKLRGTCRDGQPVTEPVATVTAGGMHLGEVRAFLLKYYNTATGQAATEPLHSATAKARFGVVMVAGEPWQIVDIGMRMLTPRELFRAQGFPESYVIDPVVDGKPLTKTAQIRLCGNSVAPDVAAALVAANYGEEALPLEVSA